MDGANHWYTVAKWIPDAKNEVMMWGGPGQFTDGGETSINGVYFDCAEIIPVDEIAE